MPRALFFANLAAAGALVLAPFSSFAAPGAGDTSRALLPPDAYSLAQPEKLATPREAQHANSPLKLAPPRPITAPDPAGAAEIEPPLKPSTGLLFPLVELKALPPQPMGKPLLYIREDRPEDLHLPTLPALNLPLPHESGLAREAAETLAESLGEPVWFDPELAETAAKAGANPLPPGTPEPGRRDPRDLLSRSILKMERETTPEFIYGEDGEAMSPTEELHHEDFPELPSHDSADSHDAEYIYRR